MQLRLAFVLMGMMVACGDDTATPDDGASLAQALKKACPVASPDDAAARTSCSEALAELPILRRLMPQGFRWGGQTEGAGYDPTRSNTTHFNPFVWRRMYLSTFMFDGSVTEVQDGTRTIYRLPVRFRGKLDPGDYPYPFWHSDKKWRSYEAARELLFILERGAVTAVLRSSEQDAAREHVVHAWDMQWTWTSARGAEPQESLYARILAADNPHRAALDQAYRDFSELQRTVDCVSCHDPSNKQMANPLELFSYPNQALSGRHNIVARLEHNDMPPSAGPGLPAGIADETLRTNLLAKARAFAELGDQALAFEGDTSAP